MTPSSLYIIKSSVLLAVLLLYYVLVLRKQTFFTLNRVYLLGALTLSICAPLFHFTITLSSQSPEEGLPTLYYVSGLMEEVTVSGQTSSEKKFLFNWNWIYLGGVIFFSLRYLKGIFQICRLIYSHKRKRIHKLILVSVGSGYPTFSFFNYIFLNTVSLNRANRHKIFEHERIHVRQGHCFDLFITEIICILNWFNPFVWAYKKIITQNHEYIADKQVIVKYQTGSYLQLLVNQAFKGNIFSFTNCFSCSNLKKRMIMMTKKQSNKLRILNYIPALFIGGTLCTLFTCITTQAPALPFIPEEKPEMVQETAMSAADTSAIFQAAETMPKFNGDLKAWMRKNLKYPAKAMEEDISGRVFVCFVVEKDGSLTNIKVNKKVDPLLDAEAIRVVKAMPAWIPGKQRGDAVRVGYTLPVSFFLPPKAAVFNIPEVMPKFNGDLNAWMKTNLKYPAKAQEAKEQGHTFVGFVVNEDGSLSGFKIQRSSGSKTLDEEALRVVKAMPAWIPGKQKGVNVKTNFSLPVNFSL